METIDDVVKRLRDRAEARRKSGKLLQIDDRMFDLIADDIEAAIKQEREAPCKESSQVGNAAAMYEALNEVVKVGYPHNFQHELPHIRGYCYEITMAIDKCFAALSEPQRNCDRQFRNAYDVLSRFTAETGRQIFNTTDVINWLFAEAKGSAE